VYFCYSRISLRENATRDDVAASTDHVSPRTCVFIRIPARARARAGRPSGRERQTASRSAPFRLNVPRFGQGVRILPGGMVSRHRAAQRIVRLYYARSRPLSKINRHDTRRLIYEKETCVKARNILAYFLASQPNRQKRITMARVTCRTRSIALAMRNSNCALIRVTDTPDRKIDHFYSIIERRRVSRLCKATRRVSALSTWNLSRRFCNPLFLPFLQANHRLSSGEIA